MPRTMVAVMVLIPWFWGCGGESSSSSDPSNAEVIFRSKEGKVLTLEDLNQASGTVDYEIVGGSDYEISQEAKELHEQGRRLGAAGDYQKSLELLGQARALAPKWPYPVYDMAYTYLLMEDFEQAREFYAKTVELSPRGFFSALTALDTLDREAAGDLPPGTYLAYVSLEWIPNGNEKSSMITFLTEKYPQYAPAWKEYALLCNVPEDRLAALEKGLAANPDRETQGILLINKATTLDQMGQKQEAVNILGNLALDPKSTFGSEHLAKQVLRMISVERE